MEEAEQSPRKRRQYPEDPLERKILRDTRNRNYPNGSKERSILNKVGVTLLNLDRETLQTFEHKREDLRLSYKEPIAKYIDRLSHDKFEIATRRYVQETSYEDLLEMISATREIQHYHDMIDLRKSAYLDAKERLLSQPYEPELYIGERYAQEAITDIEAISQKLQKNLEDAAEISYDEKIFPLLKQMAESMEDSITEFLAEYDVSYQHETDKRSAGAQE
ncbi:hypothetical protein KXW65_003470 [Aspergillus fumigatus]|nr:hypothetical protein KXX63_002021 [Aspergillus fumigatus]KAH1452225.1 hypothetical protein KXX58_003299 [Aspergillus fumigatus]KAH1508425.1 hypothetical protein KXX29_006422 [Aspergillus fumigatus]KAH1805615.1 hypothetical protein KXX19_005056 [Aspergillus fumigatus]KAH2002838.1 hypothetical protein KXV45_002691 [Aspergillus fumigatus]